VVGGKKETQGMSFFSEKEPNNFLLGKIVILCNHGRFTTGIVKSSTDFITK
jgi:hypothetical protein